MQRIRLLILFTSSHLDSSQKCEQNTVSASQIVRPFLVYAPGKNIKDLLGQTQDLSNPPFCSLSGQWSASGKDHIQNSTIQFMFPINCYLEASTFGDNIEQYVVLIANIILPTCIYFSFKATKIRRCGNFTMYMFCVPVCIRLHK